MEKVIVLIMAGGAGDRLQPLTKQRSKSAVPFGGKFRLIDFTLSNCVNSGTRQVYILTQYKSGSLLQHIQEGWGISRSGLGDYIYCVPAQQKMGKDWYMGTADAVRQNLDLVQTRDAEHILILSGDHVYKMNYAQLAAFHKTKNADMTISAVRVKKDLAAGKLGVLEADRDSRLVSFQEKPAEPKTLPDYPDLTFASMGIYLFSRRAMTAALKRIGDDFGKDIIPGMIGHDYRIFVYDYEKENRIEDTLVEVVEGKRRKVPVSRTRDSSYWRDVGTIDAYYEASMDLVGLDPLFNLYGQKWPLRTYQRPLPPSKCVLGGATPDSIVCDGCIVSGGRVLRSVLSPGVTVEKDALVEESIVFDDVSIEPGAQIRRAIIDKEVTVRSWTSIGYDHGADQRRGCTVTPSGIVVVPKGLEIR